MVQPGDPSALARAIETTLADGAAASAHAAAGRRRVAAEFDVDVVARRLELEMLGGAQRIGPAQQSARHRLLQIIGDQSLRQPRRVLVEDPPDFGETPGRARDEPVQRDRIGRGHLAQLFAADVVQRDVERLVRPQDRGDLRAERFARPFDHGCEQHLLGRKIAPQRSLGPAQRGGDRRHRRAAVPMFEEIGAGDIEDRVAARQTPGLSAAGGGGRLHGHRYHTI